MGQVPVAPNGLHPTLPYKKLIALSQRSGFARTELAMDVIDQAFDGYLVPPSAGMAGADGIAKLPFDDGIHRLTLPSLARALRSGATILPSLAGSLQSQAFAWQGAVIGDAFQFQCSANGLACQEPLFHIPVTQVQIEHEQHTGSQLGHGVCMRALGMRIGRQPLLS